MQCHNANCTDYNLRRIAAYMMGLDEFSEEEFEKQVESITVFSDKSMEFCFQEGQIKRWQGVQLLISSKPEKTGGF